MLDLDYRGFWRFDQNQILLEPWETEKTQDGIGRNAFAYICWPNETWLKDTLMNCIRQRDDTFVQFYRYPRHGAIDMSRDHVGAIILALHINRDEKELKFVLDNLPWRLSRKYTQTIDFWLWQKALKWEKFRYLISNIFYALNLLIFSLIIPWNFIIRTMIGIYKVEIKDLPVEYEEFKGIRKLLKETIYPHFSLFLLSWQIKVLPDSFLKYILQRFLLLESRNIVIDSLLGKELTKERYESFQPTTSFIWSRPIDSTDEIYMKPSTEEEMRFNDLNKGMLDYLYFGIDKLVENCKDETMNQIKNQQQIIHY